MKFQVQVLVVSDKEGLSLEEQYERLGWPEEHRADKFKTRTLTLRVSKDFALRHRESFDDIGRRQLHIPLEMTDPTDWADWGSAGIVLNTDTIDEDRIENWM